MRVAVAISITAEEREQLLRFSRGRSTPARLVLRSKIVLLAEEGLRNDEIALRLDTLPKTVSLWRRRFAEAGIPGIEKDAPGRGRPKTISDDFTRSIVATTTQEAPPNATHWSTRSLAKRIGVSDSTVRRVWRAHGLKPHLQRTFKISNDPNFAEKLEDIVGLYLNQSDHAIVLSCDEKTQIQALDRTQASLPFKSGRSHTVTHDYRRNGTINLFAAMDVATGKLISMCSKRHRHQEWLQFLKKIDKETPQHLAVHIVADNYATHKHRNVKRWLERHPRFVMHFTPTGASWLNMVERFFRDITMNRIRRGTFPSAECLQAALEAYIESHNLDPKPFIWTAKAQDILAKVTRAKQSLANNHPSV